MRKWIGVAVAVGMLVGGGTALGAEKQILVGKQTYTVDELAPEFGDWQGVVLLQEAITPTMGVLAIQFVSPDEATVVTVGFLFEDGGACILGVSVEYVRDGSKKEDTYANLHYIRTGEKGFRLERVPKGTLAELVPPFIRERAQRSKQRL